jgi:hypothetical protein
MGSRERASLWEIQQFEQVWNRRESPRACVTAAESLPVTASQQKMLCPRIHPAAIMLAPISTIGEADVGLSVDIIGAAIFALAAGANAMLGEDEPPRTEPV